MYGLMDKRATRFHPAIHSSNHPSIQSVAVRGRNHSGKNSGRIPFPSQCKMATLRSSLNFGLPA